MAETDGHHELWRRTRSWMHRKTADVVQDYPLPKVPEEPSKRTIARLLVTALAVAGVIATISFVYINSDSSRTVRHWGCSYLLTLPTSQRNFPNLLCPCNKSAIPWPHYISFYWLNYTVVQNRNSSNRYPITNYAHFCDPLNVVVNGTSGAWLQGCYLMGQSLIYKNETMRTTVSTNTVTAPSVLAHIISVQMQDSVENVLADYAYLPTKYFADWVQLSIVKQMFSSAAIRLVSSTKSMKDKNGTNEYYWRFFRGLNYTSPPNGAKVRNFDLTGHKALVLEMNWTVYVNDQCRPPYCDQVVTNSLLRRFVTAMTQVGGFAAVMTVVLRGAVWPCIRSLNRWP